MKWRALLFTGGLGLALFAAGCGAQTTTTGAGSSASTPPGATTTGNQVTANTTAAPAVGHLAPSFNLALLDGKGSLSLQQLLTKGQPILLNAWASWCPPCKMETPDLVKMSNEYKGKMQFVGIDMTTQETNVANASAFVKKYGISYPVLMDTNGSFMNAYALQGFPTTFIISPQGKVLNIEFGMMTADQMKQVIDKAIAASK